MQKNRTNPLHFLLFRCFVHTCLNFLFYSFLLFNLRYRVLHQTWHCWLIEQYHCNHPTSNWQYQCDSYRVPRTPDYLLLLWSLTIWSWNVPCYTKIVMHTTQRTHWRRPWRRFAKHSMWNFCENLGSSSWYEQSNVLLNSTFQIVSTDSIINLNFSPRLGNGIGLVKLFIDNKQLYINPYMCRKANMPWSTCVAVKEIPTNQHTAHIITPIDHCARSSIQLYINVKQFWTSNATYVYDVFLGCSLMYDLHNLVLGNIREQQA